MAETETPAIDTEPVQVSLLTGYLGSGKTTLMMGLLGELLDVQAQFACACASVHASMHVCV